MISDLAQFSFGLVLGIVPAIAWGLMGGDEQFTVSHPHLRKLLHYVHHWTLGLIGLVIVAVIPQFCLKDFLLAFFTSLYLDDALFHSFEQYFKRKS